MAIDFRALSAPFNGANIKWRVGMTAKSGASVMLLAYVDARIVQNRLDAVVGPANWKVSYDVLDLGNDVPGIKATLSIKCDGEWVSKEDCGSCSDIEPVKGGTSDAFKRAAVAWGIGRHLYDMPTTWANVVKQKPRNADNAIKVRGGWVIPPTVKSAPLIAPKAVGECQKFIKTIGDMGYSLDEAKALAKDMDLNLDERKGRVALYNYIKAEASGAEA